MKGSCEDLNQSYDFPWLPTPEEPQKKKKQKRDGERKCSISVLISVVCITIVASMLLTYTLTSSFFRDQYIGELEKKQEEINELESSLQEKPTTPTEFEKLDVLAQLLERYSYYAPGFDEEAMMDAVLKAYADATGDHYAEYYTQAEYDQIVADSTGEYKGIGVSVIQTAVTVNGYEYQAFQVISIYENSPAENSDLCVGDYIYAVKSEDGTFLTVEEWGGYTAALNAIRGEEDTAVSLGIFHFSEGSYTSVEMSFVRKGFVKKSVSYAFSETDPTTGIVQIAEFDMTTPIQFKVAVNALLEAGAKHFVFDVRNNPGGDLQSIRAVLSFILEDGDLVLSAIDHQGNVAESVYAGAATFAGDYAPCSVLPQEVGMYKDLDMVVLCNENTASAAEVFASSLRDHMQIPIIGSTTYGKGIMQRTFSLASLTYGAYQGYIKMTVYAYVTESGVTYHEVGIVPDVRVDLSEEAKQYSVYLLPEALDDQLKAAIAAFEN